MKNRLSKEIHRLSEQSDDLVEKLRDDLRHKKEEEKRRLEMCTDVQQQIDALEEQLHSMDIDADEQEDLKLEWDHLEETRKKLTEQQTHLTGKHQQVNDELRRLQQDIQSSSSHRRSSNVSFFV